MDLRDQKREVLQVRDSVYLGVTPDVREDSNRRNGEERCYVPDGEEIVRKVAQARRCDLPITSRYGESSSAKVDFETPSVLSSSGMVWY